MKHINELYVSFAGNPVGILALRQRRIWFQYDVNWLQQGFDLAPLAMHFNSEPQLAKFPVFQGLHGIFYDSLPDGWGMLLMDHFFKKTFSWDPHEVTPLDRLAYLGKRSMGGLEYAPVITDDQINEKINLSTLVENAERIMAGKTKIVLPQMRILGGSPGGARPKVTVALSEDSDECLAGVSGLPAGFQHWLIKFRGQEDPKEMGRIEKSYSSLAKLAGLTVPPSRLIKVQHQHKREEFFAVQRFDREGQIKRHVITLSGYLYADHRLPSLDYNALLAATSLLTKDIREVRQAFRLMIFNIVMHNKDDHAKNFSFLSNQEGSWQLAPAYDLTFSKGMNNEHTTAINGNGNPSYRDVGAIAEAHGIDEWEKIVSEVVNAVAAWKKVASSLNVTKPTIERIAKILNHGLKKI